MATYSRSNAAITTQNKFGWSLRGERKIINAGHHRKHRIVNVKFRGKDRAPARRYYENLSKRFCKRMSHKYSRRKLELENENYLIGNPYYLR